MQNTWIEDEGAIALAESPYLQNVFLLDLYGNHMTDRGAQALTARFGDRAAVGPRAGR